MPGYRANPHACQGYRTNSYNTESSAAGPHKRANATIANNPPPHKKAKFDHMLEIHLSRFDFSADSPPTPKMLENALTKVKQQKKTHEWHEYFDSFDYIRSVLWNITPSDSEWD